jgi:hypothetical protein
MIVKLELFLPSRVNPAMNELAPWSLSTVQSLLSTSSLKVKYREPFVNES